MIPAVFTFPAGAMSEEGECWLVIICCDEEDGGTFSPKEDVVFVTDSAGRCKKALVGP